MKLQLEGNVNLIRRFMTSEKKSIEMQIQDLNRKRREKIRAGGTGFSIDDKIVTLEEKRKMFFVTRFRPAKFEGVVINFLLLDKFIKKLKGYDIRISSDENSVIVEYTKGENRGSLKLHDISRFYNVKDLPKVVIKT